LRLLTQAGQLTEATALLQWMFRGERAPGRAPPTIDLKANEVSKADPAAPAETPTVTPRRRRPLFDRAKDGTWLGLRGVKHAPASVTDIVPEGVHRRHLQQQGWKPNLQAVRPQRLSGASSRSPGRSVLAPALSKGSS
jgi:hypothetical protein